MRPYVIGYLLLPLVLAAGCSVPVSLRGAQEAPRSESLTPGPVSVGPLQDPEVLGKEATAWGREGLRALADLSAAKDPIVAAPGALRRVRQARAALDELAPAASGEAAGVAWARSILVHTEGLLTSTIDLDPQRLQAAAISLEGAPGGKQAALAAGESVKNARTALHKRYASPWPRTGVVLFSVEGPLSVTASPVLLSQWEREQVHAVVFADIEDLQAFPEQAREIAGRGHALGLLLRLPQAATGFAPALQEALAELKERFRELTGQPLRYVRLPEADRWSLSALWVAEEAGLIFLQPHHMLPLHKASPQTVESLARQASAKGEPLLLTLTASAGAAPPPASIEAAVRALRKRGLAPANAHADTPGYWPYARELLAASGPTAR